MKKILPAIIVVVLLLAMFTILASPRVKAQTSQIKVLDYYWYTAPADTSLAGYIGDLIAVGEVQNVGTSVISYVELTGVAINSTGEVLNSNEAQASGFNLLPGQKAPFYIDFNPANSITGDQTYITSVSKVNVGVTYVSETNSTPYQGLTIPTASTTASDVAGAFTVTGTVHNAGTQTVGNVLVVTTFYNASGNIISFNFTNYLTTNSGSSNFAPGDSSTFTATPIDNSPTLSSEIANYTFLLQSQPASTSPTFTPSSSTTPTPSGVTTAPTQTPTQLSSAVTYGAVAAVVIIVVVLIALLFLRNRKKTEQSEPPPPPPPPPPPT